MKENYINILFEVGLSFSEAKVYLALLEKGISQVGEIVKLSGVPQQKIYYVLQKLLNRGLCSLIPGKVKKYKAENPSIGIGNFIDKTQKQMDILQVMVTDLERQYQRGKKENNNLQRIEIIQNSTQIVEKVLSFEQSAKEEVLSFNRAPYAMVNRNVEETKGLKKGIKYRVIYEVDEVKRLVDLLAIDMYIKAGEEVKIVTELPLKMMIFDSRILMFAIEDDIIPGTSFSIAIIQRSNLVKGMKELFEVYWQKAMTYEEFILKRKNK